MKPDVLVVGAGVVGISSAWFLAEEGLKVAVVDIGDVAAGCSGGNAGLIVPSHSVPMAAPGMIVKGMKWMFNPESPFYVKFRWDLALFSWLWKFRAACSGKRVRRAIPVLRDLSRASAALYGELARGMDCAYERKGLLLVYRSEHGFEEGREEARLLREFGLSSEAMDGAGARAMVPSLRAGVVGAVHYPEDAHLDPGAFVRGLATRCESRGVTILTQTEVLGFVTSGRRIDAVRTTQGDFCPAQVVLAAGSWSSVVARDLALRIPIQPAKGYSMTFAAPKSSPPMPLICMEAKVAVTPMGASLRLGGTLELAGLDLSINPRRLDAIRRGAETYLDGLEGMELRETWRGLRPCTPDGLPILGRPRAFDNLILATGHAMIGMSLGPVTGRIVARLAAGRESDIDLALLAPDRFD